MNGCNTLEFTLISEQPYSVGSTVAGLIPPTTNPVLLWVSSTRKKTH